MAIDSGVKIKVAFVGPCQSGKTTLSNFLADATEVGCTLKTDSLEHLIDFQSLILESDLILLLTEKSIFTKFLRFLREVRRFPRFPKNSEISEKFLEFRTKVQANLFLRHTLTLGHH